MESFAISGTSGIGKSLFFVYILHRLMDDFTTKTLSLKPNRIVYQVGSSYKCFDLQQQLVTELGLEVANIVWKQGTFYIVDGHTTPMSSCCIVLFMSSPQSEGYKEFVKQKMAKEWDFPVWTLDELQTCRRHCYPDVPIETINERYRMYGGVARPVFDIVSNPMEKALTDVDAVKGVRNIGFTIKISATTHTLLHIIASDDGQYKFLHVDIASRYVGEQLWQRHSAQMITNMQQMFGSIPTKISRHLFEIYGHVVFCTGGQTLKCRCLEDGKATKITLDALNGQRITFGINTIPTAAALDGNYYEPTDDDNFVAIDSLSRQGMFQFTAVAEHPIREVDILTKLCNLYDEPKLYFVVPPHQFKGFKKQSFKPIDGTEQVQPIHGLKQYVIQLPVIQPDLKSRK
ncbi:squalene synthetase-like protein [Batrachochytrium dendrobatidis]